MWTGSRLSQCTVIVSVKISHLKSEVCASTRMSALGQKRTCAVQQAMSALPPKADMCSATRHVRFVPIADMLTIPSRSHALVDLIEEMIEIVDTN